MLIRFIGKYSVGGRPRRDFLRKQDIPEWAKNKLLGLNGETIVSSVKMDELIVSVKFIKVKGRKKPIDRYIWKMEKGYRADITIKDRIVSKDLLYDTIDTNGIPEEEEERIDTIDDFVGQADLQEFRNGNYYYVMEFKGNVKITCMNVDLAIREMYLLIFDNFTPRFTETKFRKVMIRLVITHNLYDDLKCGVKIGEFGFFRNRLTNSLDNCFGTSKITGMTVEEEIREFYRYFKESKSYICTKVYLKVMIEP